MRDSGIKRVDLYVSQSIAARNMSITTRIIINAKFVLCQFIPDHPIPLFCIKLFTAVSVFTAFSLSYIKAYFAL